MHFWYFWTDFGEIWYWQCVHDTTEQLWALWKSAQWKSYFTYGCEWNWVCVFTFFTQVDIIQYSRCAHNFITWLRHVNWNSEICTLFFGDIWCVRSVHIAVEYLLVSWKLPQVGLYLSCECKWNCIYMRTMQVCDIWKVKNFISRDS